jgi:hypothetical protein
MRIDFLRFEDARSAAAATLDAEVLERAWAEGRAMDLQAAVDDVEGLVADRRSG